MPAYFAHMRATEQFGIRVPPPIKAALGSAAKADVRSIASLVEKIVTDWLRTNRYLVSVK
jgi:hypothetical protein